MMFDEQPDGDPHGECAAEIHRLQALSNETLDFLAMMFDSYEEGPDCYEDPEDCSGHIGKAIHLDDEAFQRIADILNTHRPRNAAVTPAPTFADGMTKEDDRRFLELTNDLTHNGEVSGASRPAGEASTSTVMLGEPENGERD